MTLEFITFEVPKKSWVQPVTEIYKEKIAPFHGFEFKWIKSKTFLRKSASESRKQQSDLLRDKVNAKNYLILFDERGKTLASRAFAEMLAQAVESGKQKTQFIIGGHYGVDDELRKDCQQVISLSSLVLNQEVAITVALEQIYRALTICKNIPYHND